MNGHGHRHSEYETHWNLFKNLKNGYDWDDYEMAEAFSPFDIIKEAEENPLNPFSMEPIPPPKPILISDPAGGPPIAMMAPPGGGPLVPYKMIDQPTGPPPPPILVTPPGGGPP